MKILHVSHSFYPCFDSGGVVRSTYEMSKELVARGHEVTVYTTDGCSERLDVKKNTPVDVQGIKVYYFRNLSNNLRIKLKIATPYHLLRIINKDIQNYDVIHIHEHRTILAAIVHYYAIKHKIPYIIQARGSVMPFFQKIKYKKVFDLLWGFDILKDAKMVIALTNDELKQYQMMGVDLDKIKIVPNGIDESFCNNVTYRKFRLKYGITDDTKIILYLGRIHKIKGIDLLIEAFSELNKEEDDIKLVIAGPDDGFLDNIQSLVKDLKIENHVLFTGPLYNQDKIEAYSDADVYVLPSFYEIFGNTVLEACSCGTPVVVTDRCGISDFVNEFGYVTTFDKHSLKNAIKKVLDNDLSNKKNGMELKKLLKEKFGQDQIFSKIEGLYNEVYEEKINEKV